MYEVDSPLISAGWPRIDHTLDIRNVDDPALLTRFGNGRLEQVTRLDDDELVLTVDPDDRDHPAGSWDIGDGAASSSPPTSIRGGPTATPPTGASSRTAGNGRPPTANRLRSSPAPSVQ